MPTEASEAISGLAVEHVGVDVRATFGEFMLNSGWIIRLFGRPDQFYAVSISILQPTGSSYWKRVKIENFNKI